MYEQIGPAGHEPVDSASSISVLKSRLIEMALNRKQPNEPTQTGWKQKDIQNGFNITYKAIFIPELFVLSEENDLSVEASNESNRGMAVLLRSIYNADTEGELENEPFISYLIRIAEGEDPQIIISIKDSTILQVAQDAQIQMSGVDDCLADMIIEEGVNLAEARYIRLTEKSNKFVEKLLDELKAENLELIQDDSSSDH